MNTNPSLEPTLDGFRRVICCHRATLSGAFAPNSLSAVRECVAAGVPRLEIDVRFISDDAMLIFHDGDLDRETTGTGKVALLDRPTATKLRYLRSDEPIAFLDDVVAALERSDTLLQVDLKLMRPISAARIRLLADALEPVRSHVLIGSQAHWNLRPFADLGFPVALDPTLQWHYRPGRDPGLIPGRLGLHGLWDDAPLAHIREASSRDYLAARTLDLIGLLPQAAEWMVDIGTLLHLDSLGWRLGAELKAHGIALAAWTARDEGPERTMAALRRLAAIGATTIIADDAPRVASHAAALSADL